MIQDLNKRILIIISDHLEHLCGDFRGYIFFSELVSDAKYYGLVRPFIIFSAIALFGALMTLIVASSIVRSLRSLKDSIDRIARGDLENLVPVKSHDEIGQLSVSLNKMIVALGRVRGGMVSAELKEITKQLEEK